MRELVQSANEGTMDTTERGYLQQEFNLLRSELNRIMSGHNGRNWWTAASLLVMH